MTPPLLPDTSRFESRNHWPTAALLLALALTATGCARTYAITTYTGGTILCQGRPKLQGGFYLYRDADGREQRINELRVREVAAQ